MEFRKTTIEDINKIMAIFKQAQQQYFKDNYIDQWQNNYPNIQTLKR